MYTLSSRSTLHASSASILTMTSIITSWSDLMIIRYSLTYVAWWSRLNRSMSETFMIWTRQWMNWIQTLSSILVIEISKFLQYFSFTLIIISSFIKIDILSFVALLNRLWEIVIFVKQRAFNLSVLNAHFNLSKISWRIVVIIIWIRKSLLLLYADR